MKVTETETPAGMPGFHAINLAAGCVNLISFNGLHINQVKGAS